MLANTSAPITLLAPLAKPSFLVLDLETGDAPAEDIANVIAAWKAPSNWKPETVEAKKREFAANTIKRAALLDASPILCIGMQTDNARMLFNGMDDSAPEINGWPVVPCGEERGMLMALRAWLDASTSADTLIVGHNIRGFDLPKLRHAYIRHSLRLPQLLMARIGSERVAETVDTASLFKAFSMEHRDEMFISLDTVAMSLGIPRPKQHISGEDVPRLHKEGQFEAILTYCAVDVATTTRAYQLMTSTALDIE